MEVILLGTGAALPTKWRASSALVVAHEGELLLFDCGEGTQVQFQKAELRPGKLRRIFISHFHGDHIYGLIGLLTSLQLNGRETPLDLYGPRDLADYLEYMQGFSRFKFRYAVSVHEVAPRAEAARWDCGAVTVSTRRLDHGIPTLGFRVEEKPKPGKFDVQAAEQLGVPPGPQRARLQAGETVRLADGSTVRPEQVLGPPRPGRKVAIVLDSRPCRNAQILAQEADLLVHEGTFDQSQAARAAETGHATVTQAAQLARDAGCKKLLLTHISARYREEDEDALLQQAKAVFPNTILGRDLLRIEV